MRSYAGSFDKALQAAESTNKTLLLYFTAAWCAPCKLMEKKVFVDKQVVSLIDSLFVFYKVDIDSASGKHLKKRFDIRTVPSFSVIDGIGERTYHFSGYNDADNLIQQLKEGLDPENAPINLLRKQYENGDRSIGFLRRYLNTLEEYHDSGADSVYALLCKLSSPQEMKGEFMWAKMNAYINSDTTEDYRFLKDHKSELVFLYGEERVNHLLARPYSIQLENAALESNVPAFYKLAGKLKNGDFGNTDRLLYENEKLLFLQIEDYDKFISLIEAQQYPSLYPDRYDRLIDGATWVVLRDINHGPLLEKAKMWINESLNHKISSQQYIIAGQLHEKTGDLTVALRFYGKGLKQYRLDNPAAEMEPTGLHMLIADVEAKIKKGQQ
ncbi:thioredoxin family protein [Parapedobacter luteus]|nr:thioredoxin family protein [Parapedobacter luteus]